MRKLGQVLIAVAALAASAMLMTPASAQTYYYGDARSGVYVGPAGHGHVRPGPRRQYGGHYASPKYYQSRPQRRPNYAVPVIAGAVAGAAIATHHQRVIQRRTTVRRTVTRTPSPAQIAASVPHRVERRVASCAAGYWQSEDGWCHRSRWVPGP